MSGIYSPLLGRMGNKMFQWAHAKALAEREGCELITPDWEGQKIFEIEPTRQRQDGDLEIGGYCQNQESLIYTRRQVREWFKVRESIVRKLWMPSNTGLVVAHRRVGDYAGYGYPVVSEKSYNRAREQHGLSAYDMVFVTEENPMKHPDFIGDMALVPDFYRLMRADMLLRGNSSFSWWAATLGNGKVFSPVIDGLEGGREHDVEFVVGNHPRFCNLPFVTDLFLPEHDTLH